MRTVKNDFIKLTVGNRLLQKIYRQANSIKYMPSNSSYNLSISHKKKFIWFRVAKVGTRSILKYLSQDGTVLDVEQGTFLHYPIKKYNSYFKFAFVRNPWDRIVSTWCNKVIDTNYFNFDEREYPKMMEFKNFVNYVETLDVNNCDRHLRLQCKLIDLNNLDFLGHYEFFQIDFQEISKRLEIPIITIEKLNISNRLKDYHEYYDDVLVKKVKEIYNTDIMIFNYKF